jgi:hypothetical protein
MLRPGDVQCPCEVDTDEGSEAECAVGDVLEQTQLSVGAGVAKHEMIEVGEHELRQDHFARHTSDRDATPVRRCVTRLAIRDRATQ